MPGKGIVVCMNNVNNQDAVNQVLIHELIHAYDECRAKDLDWTKLDHHACSEIRAANLSGDCHMLREFSRGNLQLLGGHEVRSQGQGHGERGGVCFPLLFFFWEREPSFQDWLATFLQVCVRRRAQLSVAMNPSCRDPDEAKSAINRVWDTCYNDTKPFYEVP